MKRWLGIDFSGDVKRWGPRTQRSNVWMADVRRDGSTLVLHRVDPIQAWAEGEPPFRWLAAFLQRGEFAACAIDAPFSVPADFVPGGGHPALLEQVAEMERDGRPFPKAKRFTSELRRGVGNAEIKPLRLTEREWVRRGLNVRSTLWDGPRGGAAMTAACLVLLRSAGHLIWPFCGDASGPFLVEAFPMAQLRAWDLPHREYWSANAAHHRSNREAIVERLASELNLQRNEKTLRGNADAIDAVLCAFAAIAATENRIACPVPEGGIAHTEGWIAVHDDSPTRAIVDRSAFVEAVEKGEEAVRSGDLGSHSEAVRLLKSFGR